jgi:hypothetical protein
MKLIEDRGPLSVEVAGLTLPFRSLHIRTEWPVDLCLFWPLAESVDPGT